MDDKGNPISLKEHIGAAQSVKEVNELLQQGYEYKFASKKTVDRWNKVAIARIKVLSEGEKK